MLVFGAFSSISRILSWRLECLWATWDCSSMKAPTYSETKKKDKLSVYMKCYYRWKRRKNWLHALVYIDELRRIRVWRQQEALLLNRMAHNYNTSTLKLLVILVPNFCDTSLGSDPASRLKGFDPIKLAFVLLLRASCPLLLLATLRGHLLYLCKATIEEN